MQTALAQGAVEVGTIAKVEVTGSHIPRPDSETALPVMNDQLSVGSGNPGLSSANLRGLGDGNTLVLLNGRRLANYAFLSGTVDIASIPLAASGVELTGQAAITQHGSGNHTQATVTAGFGDPAKDRLNAFFAGELCRLRSTTLAFGIRNLFDRDPPFTNQGDRFQVGYDPNYGDPRGRTFHARVSYAFQ